MARPSPPVTRPGRLGPGSLGRRLVLRMVLLITVVCVGLTAVMMLATREMLLRSVDRQLQAAFTRQDRPGRSLDSGGSQVQLTPGQAAGTIVMVVWPNNVQAGILTDSARSPGNVAPLTAEAAEALLHLPVDTDPSTRNLPGYGSYRVLTMPVGDTVRVVALPLRELNHALTEMLRFALVLMVIALLAGALVTRTLIVRALQPLSRLASTAEEVSRLELSRGEVELPVRVPTADADPATEVGRVGLALNHMLSNVEGALAARQASETNVRRFVADASHELRNPLAAIRGYAELSRLHAADLPPDATYVMERVQSETERMSHLVEDMLLLARLDARPDLDREEIDVAEIVLNATSDAQAAHPDHEWGVDVPDEPVVAYADRHRLHQVVANLLANAVKHTPSGTAVTTTAYTAGDQAVITVTDNGPGIPEELTDKVFERFTRADTARTRSGTTRDSTGLGLAIVAAVMAAHGGSSDVDSRPGHTVFTLRIPNTHP